jgi:hypothetical protein
MHYRAEAAEAVAILPSQPHRSQRTSNRAESCTHSLHFILGSLQHLKRLLPPQRRLPHLLQRLTASHFRDFSLRKRRDRRIASSDRCTAVERVLFTYNPVLSTFGEFDWRWEARWRGARSAFARASSLVALRTENVIRDDFMAA